MSITINPVFPVIAAKGATPDLVLQPGTVIDARVLKVLDDTRVKIAIASLTIEVLTEVQLQPGAALQLAVSQTPDGIRLAIVTPESSAASSVPAEVINAAAGSATAAVGSLLSSIAAAPVTDVSAIAINRAVADPAPPTLTAVEALAVTAAAQAAASKQGGLSSLFANVSAAAVSDSLPEPLQQAAAQLLAIRPQLTPALSGADVKLAFENSGLFLEASLALGTVQQAEQGSMPDLKAALIVFRQTLSTWLGQAAPENPSEAVMVEPLELLMQQGLTLRKAASLDVLSLPASDIDVEEAYLPKALLPVADDFNPMFSSTGQTLNAGARAAAATAALKILQDVEYATSSDIIETIQTVVDGKVVMEPVTSRAAFLSSSEAVSRAAVPPPPFRGAALAPQTVASPSIVPGMRTTEAVHRLMDDTDGAIARQTLLQIASLPDRVDVSSARSNATAPHWNFEIPFATPQGTAVAQFEISRDGGGKSVEAVHRVWRARFSLDVEPAGPVHAIVSLSGETTSVRMWAERPETAVRLRDNASQLSRALRQAELEPGDIVIGDGTPPRPVAVAPAGHFLDRAT